MKTLQLSKEFVQVDGTVIFDEKGEKFTLKSFLLLVLGAHGAKDGKQAVELFTLAQDIYKTDADTLDVGDAFYRFDEIFQGFKSSSEGYVIRLNKTVRTGYST